MPNDKQSAPEAHDVLLIPRLFPPNETTPEGRAKMLVMEVKEDGGYKSSRWLNPGDLGARKVYNIARPVAPGEGPARGPGFAVLPIRPDPGSQYNTCFLINTENLFLPNPWTAANWDAVDPADDPAGAAKERPAHPGWPKSGFDLLVAGPQGKVFHVKGGSKGEAGSVEEIDLRTEPEIWAQLREGLIVGTVFCGKLNRVLPIVNATALHVDGGHQAGKGAQP